MRVYREDKLLTVPYI